MHINLVVGWIAILAGLIGGAGFGLFFHHVAWLGGYGSWRRRTARLAHVALVGTGLLNIVFAMSVGALGLEPAPRLASRLFLAGSATMPLVCALAAWRPRFRHLFSVPVTCLVVATLEVVVRGVWP